MKTVPFAGWDKCVELISGDFKLIVTTEVGPRIIGGFLGDSENLFYLKPETAGSTNDKEWNIYGGHRLWHSPEAKPRSYAPDNSLVEVIEDENGITFSSGLETSTGISKKFTIKSLGNEKFQVTHTIRNDNMWDIDIAAWALTVMAPGGVGIVPQPQGDTTDLLPNRYLTIWPYTNMADKRLLWGDKFTLLKQDPQATSACKFGLNCEDGWIAYANNGVALKKSFQHFSDAEYPDNGCSIEMYTCDFMLEIETLSPLHLLGPDEEIVHVEEWEAFKVNEILTEADAGQLLRT